MPITAGRASGREVWAVMSALAAGALLTACASSEPEAGAGAQSGTGTAPKGSPSSVASGQPSAQESPVSFESLEDLFDTVDERLDCPKQDRGEHFFMVDGAPETGLPGRQCGTGVLMSWSDDPAVVEEAVQLLHSGGPVPMAAGNEWFVADVTEVLQTQSGEAVVSLPESTDLESLAHELGGTFTAG
ncbi:hypothetical protein [Citricoccus sp. GCM10030269]|uniref:hypothetical protein n=1 Tax=Citricoccus sp. GCM10030269 TaxID=3273388 RepID=UPI003617A450